MFVYLYTCKCTLYVRVLCTVGLCVSQCISLYESMGH